MNGRDQFDRQLSAALTDLAAPRVPDYIDTVLERAVNRRQRPAWTFPQQWLPAAITTGWPQFAPAVPLRTVVLLILIALLTALMVAFTVGSLMRRPAAYGLAANGDLVYARNGDIYVADASGANERLVIGDPAADEGPTFSRDGTHIAFVRIDPVGTTHLMVSNADGSGLRELTTNVGVRELTTNVEWIEWAPDSRRIAVLRPIGDRLQMGVVSVDRAGVEPVNTGTIQVESWLAWRPPRGEDILFKGRYPVSSELGVYSIKPNGSDLRVLRDSTETNPDLAFQALQVSSDGKYLGYTTWGPNAAGQVNAWAHVVNIDTGEDRLDDRMSYPRFSPDSKLVLGEGFGELVLTTIDGTAPTRHIGPYVTPDAHWSDYEFSPDGSKVIWTIVDSGKTYIIDVATGEYTVHQEMPAFPSWQRLAP